MTKNRRKILSDEVIDEMILEILSRLPIESLSRFRGVSRYWCEQIVSRDGILIPPKSKERNRIARFDPQTNKLYLAREEEVVVDDDGKKRWTYCWDEKDLDSSLLLHSSISGGGDTVGIVRLLASFEDLLLLSHGEHLLLLNPSIGRCRKVFDYPPLTKSSKHTFVAGICYDSYSDDYKVLIGRNDCSDPDFVVISLESKASKPVHFPYNTCAIGPLLSGLVVDEKIHFRTYGYRVSSAEDATFNRALYRERIIYFDVFREEFMDLKIPGVPIAGSDPHLGLTLGILDGCLAISRNRDPNNYPDIKSEGFVDIWVMRKHGVEESWMVFFTISRKNNPHLYMCRPLFVTKDGGFVIIGNNMITMFNLKDKTNGDVGVPLIKLRDNSDYTCLLHRLLRNVVAYNGGTSFPLDREL